jgi:inorganic triphosphatase YgiF
VPQHATHEIELKLRVPIAHAANVERAVEGRGSSIRTHLRAAYFDTPERDLAANGMAWRVRREGRRWVQTLKARHPQAGSFIRLEHNVAVRSRGAPLADSTLHDGTEVGAQLAALLARTGRVPIEQYHTDVWRRTRSARMVGGSVELAFDRGTIASGDSSVDVCELEIELQRGSPHAVIATARTWVRRHGLWLDTVNKAQRGALLAAGLDELPVVKAPRPALTRDMPIDAAVREMVHACLQQVTANASAVAGGLGGHEHVHQARIGIRKLRTVLREFGEHSPAIDPEWGERLKATFTRLGELRDREVVLAHWNSALAAHGAPVFDTPASADTDPRDVLREPEFSVLLLDLLDYAHGEPIDNGVTAGEVVPRVLHRLHKGVRRRTRRFAATTTEGRHATRKIVKRLRYVAELTASLYKPKRIQKFLAVIEPAQDRLGELNDLVVAADMYLTMTSHQQKAWFAVGWLTAHEQEAVEACIEPLRRVARHKLYWT